MDASCNTWREAPGALDLSEEEQDLFSTFQLSKSRAQVYLKVRATRNLPKVHPKEMLWATCVATVGAPIDEDESRLAKVVVERLQQLEEAERRFGWLHGTWTSEVMKYLIKVWSCGLMVVDPNLVAKNGAPLQWTHEYYGDEYYPAKEDQTDEWKDLSLKMFALMARSIIRSYPMATTKGIISFSDMVDFDWNKYDMDTKRRNTDVTSLIPLKLARMISIRPDDKMKEFFKEMGPRALKKWGFVAYDDYESALAGEIDLMPSSEKIPTFVGGDYRLNVLECLKYLFHTEPDALALCLQLYKEMEDSGELPCPKHMQ